MNKSILSIVTAFVIIAIWFAACKKDSKSDTPAPVTLPATTAFVPTYVPPSQPGMIQVSVSQLVLHVTNTVNVSAVLYTSTGTVFSPQPTFVWNSNNTQSVSVTSGTITALQIGNSTVSVTDGSHGFAYVSVSVVADTTTILSSTLNIAFTPPLLSLNKGQSGNVSYVITNLQGQITPASPTFIISDPRSGITFSGSTVTAGSKTGLYTITALVGADTLNGSFNVLVFDNQSTSTDTVWQINPPLSRVPSNFFDINQSALPVVLEVTGYTTGKNPGLITFQTSPTEIDIDNPNVVTVKNGLLSSVNTGYTQIHAHYKNAVESALETVQFNFNGSWGGGGINICFSEYYTGVIYWWQFTSFLITSEGYNPSCSWYIHTKCGTVDSSGIAPHGGGFNWNALPSIAPEGQAPTSYNMGTFSGRNYPSCATYYLYYQDYNHIVVKDNNSVVATITRGAGNCSPQDSSGTLAQDLSGNGSKIWTADPCMLTWAAGGDSTIVFYSNGATDFFNGNNDTTGTKWTVNGNYVIFSVPSQNYQEWVNVISYSSTQIVFSDSISSDGKNWFAGGPSGCNPTMTYP